MNWIRLVPDLRGNWTPPLRTGEHGVSSTLIIRRAAALFQSLPTKMLLETTRLRLREMTCNDAPFLHELMNDPGYIANVADRGIRTHDDARQWLIKKILPSYQRYGFGSYLVELKETGAAIGS